MSHPADAPSTRYGFAMTPNGLSQAAQADLDRIMKAGLDAAERELMRVSDFLPFVHTMDAEGRLLAASFDLSELGRHPEPEAVLDAVVARLRPGRTTMRATSIIVNTRLQAPRTDAIELRLEHAEGASMLVLAHYKRAKFGGRVEFGETRVFSKKPEIWW
jgi:hypothetical protein